MRYSYLAINASLKSLNDWRHFFMRSSSPRIVMRK